jgi:hypothetical protein
MSVGFDYFPGLPGGKAARLSAQTLKTLSELAPESRDRVEKLVRTHIEACLRNGSPLENIERVYSEAIEVAAIESRHPEAKGDYLRDWEPARRYDQYFSPREL